jgi:hypothetical protein
MAPSSSISHHAPALAANKSAKRRMHLPRRDEMSQQGENAPCLDWRGRFREATTGLESDYIRAA